VLARIGAATGPFEWVLRHGTAHQSLGTDHANQLVWGDSSHIVSVGPTSLAPPEPVGIWRDTVGGALAPVLVLPEGASALELHGVRNGLALLLLRPQISWPGGDPRWSEAVLVDLSSGRTGVVLTPGEQRLGGLHFAGWLPTPSL
jgi:hypothetical protein